MYYQPRLSFLETIMEKLVKMEKCHFFTSLSGQMGSFSFIHLERLFNQS